ncbi:MAG: metal/formaldehyde-sensitive transcriptional repressor [Pseudomonadota bacterium]|nr:metal/formaldehyde-sensitive transcriptional repressor [Pseudomonadota bacterium]
MRMRVALGRSLALGAMTCYTPTGMKASPSKPSNIEKSKLVKRLSRIRGQIDALNRELAEQDAPSARLLQQATACRGALDGFIAEVIEDQIRELVVVAETRGEASAATEELIGLVHTYLT